MKVKLYDQRERFNKASSEGKLDYQVVADYNEFLQTSHRVLTKKQFDLSKKHRLLYSLASKSAGKKYDQFIAELQRVNKLLETLRSDAEALNGSIGEFKGSDIYKHCIQLIDEKCVLTSDKRAVLMPSEDDQISVEELIAKEKAHLQTMKAKSSGEYRSLEQMLADSDLQAAEDEDIGTFRDSCTSKKAVWKNGRVLNG